MAIKGLKTRIALKYDTLANWTAADKQFPLLPGEIACVEISATNIANKQHKPVMFKVGVDGVKTFNELEWASALAADVYDWAKKAGIEVEDSNTGKFVTDLSWDAQNNKLVLSRADIDWSDIQNKVNASTSTDGLMSKEDKAKLDAISSEGGKVANAGHADTATNATNAEKANTATTAEKTKAAITVLGESFDGSTAVTIDAADVKTAIELNKYATTEALEEAIGDIVIDTLSTGSANGTVAFNGKDVEVKGLGSAAYTEASAYDVAGAAKEVSDALVAYKTSNDAAVSAAAAKGQQGIDDAAAALAKANEKTTMAEVEAKNYATKAEAQAMADGKDAAIKAAKDAADAAQADIDAFFSAADKGEAALDTLKEIQDFLNSDSGTVQTLVDDVASNKEAIADIVDGTTPVAKATNADKAADADKLGGADAADYLKKADAPGYDDILTKTAANTAYQPKGEYATAAQGAKADTAVQPDALNNYYTKTEADTAFMDSTETDTAIDNKIQALNLATTYEPIGAESRAKAYTDGLAKNYATAAQGEKADSALQKADIVEGSTNGTIAVKGTEVKVHGLGSAAYTEASAYATAEQGTKADSALQSVEVGTGLKVSTKTDNKQTVEIDEEVIFVFNCGNASDKIYTI